MPARDRADPERRRGPTRRDLLIGAVASGAGAFLGSTARADPPPSRPPAPLPIPTRPFGKTGRRVTLFGLGCYYVGAASTNEAGEAVVRRAYDLGCRYFDTAPSYVGGASERRVGAALEGRRDDVFLSTKTLERTRAGARRDLEESLKRLRTDHVDLLQVHCVRTKDDLDVVLSDAGPLPAILEAKEKGLVRHVGVSGHEDPAVMKRALERYGWDSVLLPLNAVDAHWRSFVEGTLPTAVEKGVARVAMKVFASGKLLTGEGALSAADCLRFTYGLDVSCAIVGCATTEEVDLAARIASEQRPLAAEAKKTLVASSARFSGRPPAGVEWYKRAEK